MKKCSKKNLILLSLTLFSMFFGAGNLIFPPFLAKMRDRESAGVNWFSDHPRFPGTENVAVVSASMVWMFWLRRFMPDSDCSSQF